MICTPSIQIPQVLTLELIKKEFPDLKNHPVVSFYAQTSKETEKNLEFSLRLDGKKSQVIIHLSRDLEIVKGSTVYKIIKKLHEAGELDFEPIFIICDDPVSTRRYLCFGGKKFNPNQVAATLILDGTYQRFTDEALLRMARNFFSMEKGRTSDFLAKLHPANRGAFELGWKIKKYDEANGTGIKYLEFVKDGKATLKQIDEELCGVLDKDIVQKTVDGLLKAESTYDNARGFDVLYDDNDNIKSCHKIGAIFSKIQTGIEKEIRDTKEAKRRQEAEEVAEDADIAKKTGVVEDMPTSHDHQEPELHISDQPIYDVEIIAITNWELKELKKFSIYLQKNKFCGKAFSIKFIDDTKETKYFNIPALNIIKSTPIVINEESV